MPKPKKRARIKRELKIYKNIIDLFFNEAEVMYQVFGSGPLETAMHQIQMLKSQLQQCQD